MSVQECIVTKISRTVMSLDNYKLNSLKLIDMLDQNLPCLVCLTELVKTHSNKKCSHSLTLRAKVKVTAKKKANALGMKNHASQKEFEQGFP